MPKLGRDDGAEIHWEEREAGPTVVMVPYWSCHPSAFENVSGELYPDHRVITYDARGTGASTRRGPHDMETGAADLEAVIEAAGGPAVVVTIADSCNRAVRVAARRPDLVAGVVAPGAAPVGLEAFAGTDALISSDTVIGAFLEMVSTDYRGALRTLMTAANSQMGEDELRTRVALQAEYCPREAAIERLRAWVADDPEEAGRETGDRLWMVYSQEVGGAWFPSGQEFRDVISARLPESHSMEVDDGIVSRPDQTAAIIRRITDELRS